MRHERGTGARTLGRVVASVWRCRGSWRTEGRIFSAGWVRCFQDEEQMLSRALNSSASRETWCNCKNREGTEVGGRRCWYRERRVPRGPLDQGQQPAPCSPPCGAGDRLFQQWFCRQPGSAPALSGCAKDGASANQQPPTSMTSQQW